MHIFSSYSLWNRPLILPVTPSCFLYRLYFFVIFSVRIIFMFKSSKWNIFSFKTQKNVVSACHKQTETTDPYVSNWCSKTRPSMKGYPQCLKTCAPFHSWSETKKAWPLQPYFPFSHSSKQDNHSQCMQYSVRQKQPAFNNAKRVPQIKHYL